MTESNFVKVPRTDSDVIANNSDAYDFFTSKRVFGEEKIDEVLPYSSKEAQIHVDRDLNVMSKHLGKASQQVIKTMMKGVKSGKYDAMDLVRGIKSGNVRATHYGERDFIQQLWNKVRDKFRRYSKRGKLR